VYKELGNFERAMQHFQTAIRLRPTAHQALNHLGVLYTMQGKTKEAMEALQVSCITL
jgi:Flp pilus assembly protein TadD